MNCLQCVRLQFYCLWHRMFVLYIVYVYTLHLIYLFTDYLFVVFICSVFNYVACLFKFVCLFTVCFTVCLFIHGVCLQLDYYSFFVCNVFVYGSFVDSVFDAAVCLLINSMFVWSEFVCRLDVWCMFVCGCLFFLQCVCFLQNTMWLFAVCLILQWICLQCIVFV